MKRVLLFLLFTITFNVAFPKSSSISNQYDEEGRKDGLWIEHYCNYCTRYVYYLHGVQHGIIRGFNTYTSQLDYIGEIDQGKMVGIWLYFDEENHLLSRFYDFKDTLTMIPDVHNYSIQYAPHNCYCIDYHSNGRIKAEGRLYFFDDPRMDDAGPYGTWNYYDVNGNLEKTILYK